MSKTWSARSAARDPRTVTKRAVGVHDDQRPQPQHPVAFPRQRAAAAGRLQRLGGPVGGPPTSAHQLRGLLLDRRPLDPCPVDRAEGAAARIPRRLRQQAEIGGRTERPRRLPAGAVASEAETTGSLLATLVLGLVVALRRHQDAPCRARPGRDRSSGGSQSPVNVPGRHRHRSGSRPAHRCGHREEVPDPEPTRLVGFSNASNSFFETVAGDGPGTPPSGRGVAGADPA